MAHTLKLRGAEPVLPGLALPEAFESLDKRIESTVQLCHLKSSTESQMAGVLAICQELQRLLKFAFIENGLLASRIEILTRHQNESLQKMEKRQGDVELEHKVTKKQMKNLRKRVSKHETLQRKSREKWWDVSVKTTDYDSYTYLARGSGAPDLEFMLRINQILIDFVKDKDRTELLLPPMGNEERAELSKLTSIYKLRCRFGKSTNLASSTLIKARQTSIPAPGEVDAILDTFARLHKHAGGETPGGDNKQESSTKDADVDVSPGSEIPPTMITPFSHISTPIDVGMSSATPPQSHSPPNSGLSTPTADSAHKARRLSSSTSTDDSKSAKPPATSTESPLPTTATSVKGGAKVSQPLAVKSPTHGSSSVSPQQLQQLQAQTQGRIPIFVAGNSSPSPTQKTPGVGGGGIILTGGQMRSVGHPTVVASPLKVPLSQLPTMVQTGLDSSGKRERITTPTVAGAGGGSTPPPPMKRVRVTRQSASGGNVPTGDE